MSEKKYYIRIKKALVEVTKEVYRVYYQMDRHERYLTEKDIAHKVWQYSNLDTEDILGEEMIPDLQSTSVEDLATANLLVEKLRRCIKLLPDADQRLIHSIFYEGMSERQFARKEGIPLMTVRDKKVKILARLKSFLKN